MFLLSTCLFLLLAVRDVYLMYEHLALLLSVSFGLWTLLSLSYRLNLNIHPRFLCPDVPWVNRSKGLCTVGRRNLLSFPERRLFYRRFSLCSSRKLSGRVLVSTYKNPVSLQPLGSDLRSLSPGPTRPFWHLGKRLEPNPLPGVDV